MDKFNLVLYVSRDTKDEKSHASVVFTFYFIFPDGKQRQIALLEYCLAERTNEKNVKILTHSVIHVII